MPRYSSTPAEEFPDLPGWRFYVEEASVGVYDVEGCDDAGHVVRATGFESKLQALVEECRQKAQAIEGTKQR